MIEERLANDLQSTSNDIDRSIIQYLNAMIIRERNLKQTELTDEEIENIIYQERRKRYESLAKYDQDKNNSIVERLYKEIACLNRYLPKTMTDVEIELGLIEIIKELGDEPSKYNQILALAKAKFGNRADEKLLVEILKQLLNI